MASQMNTNVGHGPREYRAVRIGDRWQQSTFEYFHEGRNEWREVINWNSRERLFEEFAPLLARAS